MISLSTWSRDYLYLPLGGDNLAADGIFRHVPAVAVFVLCGLWHGTSWNVVIWGLYHGAFIVLERAGLGLTIKIAGAVAPRLPDRCRDDRVGVFPGRQCARGADVLERTRRTADLEGPRVCLAASSELLLLDGAARGPDGVGATRGFREPMAVTIDAATVSALAMLFATGIFIWSSLRSLFSASGAKR